MYLCIDLGSTSFKASVYDPDLNRKGTGSAYLQYAQLGERVELTPQTVRTTVHKAFTTALHPGGLASADITAVAVTSQAQTFALCDASEFQTPFISWQDRRAGALADTLKRDPVYADFALHSSFNEPLAGQMLCLLQAVLAERPELKENQIVPLSSFVIEELTGKTVLDDNLAAMTGLWSLTEKNWHIPYLQKCGITETQLPHIGPLPVSGGKTRPGNLLDLLTGIPVHSAGNDQTAGAYAAELDRDGGILITLGSAQVVYQWVPNLPAPEPGLIRGSYPGGGYYRMIADSTGGSLILRAIEQLGLDGFDSFFALAEAGFIKQRIELPETRPEPDRIHWSEEAASIELKCAATLDYLCERMANFIRHLRRDDDPLFLTDGGGARNPVWKECLEHKIGQSLPLRAAAPDCGAARMLLL